MATDGAATAYGEAGGALARYGPASARPPSPRQGPVPSTAGGHSRQSGGDEELSLQGMRMEAVRVGTGEEARLLTQKQQELEQAQQ